MFVFLNKYALNRPGVMIPNAGDKFDSIGNLTDKFTGDKMKELVAALVSWIVRYQKIANQHVVAA